MKLFVNLVPIVEFSTSKLSKDIAQTMRPFITERTYQGFISSLYFDLIETQVKATMAKQIYNCFEKDRKSSRLKRLRNRDDQKKGTVIELFKIYSFRT